MTTDRINMETVAPRQSTFADVMLDGLFTGMIGALAVVLWFLVLDLIAGRALYTPALLGSVLLQGSAAALHPVVIDPVAIAAYTAVHFLVFIALGFGLSYLMTLFERFPIMFFVLLVLFVSLQVGFLALDTALGAQLMGRLHSWSVVIANLLAASGMAFYLWRRHPSVVKSIEGLWQDEDPQS
jgi:hypothetical protein